VALIINRLSPIFCAAGGALLLIGLGVVDPESFEVDDRAGETGGGGSKTDDPVYDAVLDRNEKPVSDKIDDFLSAMIDAGLLTQNLSSSKLTGSNPNDSKYSTISSISASSEAAFLAAITLGGSATVARPKRS